MLLSQGIFQEKKNEHQSCIKHTVLTPDQNNAIGIVHQHCQKKHIQSTMPDVVMLLNTVLYMFIPHTSWYGDKVTYLSDLDYLESDSG